VSDTPKPVAVWTDEAHPCPHDPDFVHEMWPYGCVPRDFSLTTGRSRKHRQRRVEHERFPLGWRYQWDGGCDAHAAAGVSS
jgi:hypothetical protein